MRILCQTGVDTRPIHAAMGKVFAAAGHEFTAWDPATKNAFDAFDESDPHLFIGDGKMWRALEKCLDERPRTRVAERRRPWPAADTFLPDGVLDEGLVTDFAYVGNYRGDKAQLLDQYVIGAAERGRLKVFGRTRWPCPQYLGSITDERAMDLYVSARVNLNVYSSNRVNARVYQVLYAGGFCISTHLHDNDFNLYVPQADSPLAMMDLLAYYCIPGREDLMASLARAGQEFVRQNHTYWHRASDILADVGFAGEAKKVMEVFRETVRV